jgi:hypothetical protein
MLEVDNFSSEAPSLTHAKGFASAREGTTQLPQAVFNTRLTHLALAYDHELLQVRALQRVRPPDFMILVRSLAHTKLICGH